MGCVDWASILGRNGIRSREQGPIDQARRIDEERRPGSTTDHTVNATSGMLDDLGRVARRAFVPDSVAILGKAKRLKGDKPHDYTCKNDERTQSRQSCGQRDQHEHSGSSHKSLDA